MFCQFARKIGFTTWLCPWMEVNHVGTYVFNGTLRDLGSLEYAAHGADVTTRPNVEQRKQSRQERRKTERVEKKKKKLTTPEK